MRETIVHPAAAQELDEAVAWYEERQIRLAAEFFRAIKSAHAQIEDWPYSGPIKQIIAQHQIRSMTVKTYPYHVIYFLDENQIFIVAYAHDRHRPGYWKSRLTP